MKITVESTPAILQLEEGIAAQRWEGFNDSGVPVLVLVAAIMPQSDDPAVHERFSAELAGEELVVGVPVAADGDLPEPGGWKATLFSGQRERPVYGALRTTQRLHWTKEAARDEALEWCRQMKLAPITCWDPVDDKWEIGRNRTHYVIVRRILLPLGSPP